MVQTVQAQRHKERSKPPQNSQPQQIPRASKVLGLVMFCPKVLH